jgi:hypothetical protein
MFAVDHGGDGVGEGRVREGEIEGARG